MDKQENNHVKKMLNRSITDYLAIIITVFLILELVLIIPSLWTNRKIIDEGYWLHSSYFYYLFFIKKDMDHRDWYSMYSIDHPPLGKYIMGFTLDMINNKRIENYDGLAKWFERYKCKSNLCDYFRKRIDEYKPIGNMPEITIEDLFVGRMVSYTFTASILIILVILASITFDKKAVGVIAAMIFINNKVTSPIFLHAYMDTAPYFFVLITIVFIIKTLENIRTNDNRKIVIYSIFTGIFAVLGLSTKFSASYVIITIIIIYFTSSLLALRNKQKANVKMFLKSAFITSIIGIILFISLNPLLYKDPIGGIKQMIEHRQSVIFIQNHFLDERVSGLYEKIRIIYLKGILLDSKTGFGLLSITLTILFFHGLSNLLKNMKKEIIKGYLGQYSIVTIWLATSYIFIGYFVHMSWNRYFIGMALSTSIIISYAIIKILSDLEANILERIADDKT